MVARTTVAEGPVGPQEAKRAISLGVDGFHLSNHGGRQLDRCIPALDLVLPVREAVGSDTPIVLDSGIRHGADIAIAIALGANMCAIGRPYLYGLAAGGEQGVARALDLLKEELKRTMQLLGVTSLAEIRDGGTVAPPEALIVYFCPRYKGFSAWSDVLGLGGCTFGLVARQVGGATPRYLNNARLSEAG